jgi:hypothetical protein
MTIRRDPRRRSVDALTAASVTRAAKLLASFRKAL